MRGSYESIGAERDPRHSSGTYEVIEGKEGKEDEGVSQDSKLLSTRHVA